MAKSNSKTRRAQRRGTKRGGGWFSSSKSVNTANKPNPRREVDFREVLAKYANYYNARLTFKKKQGDFLPAELEQLDDAKTALTYGEGNPMPTNVRLFRGIARGIQTGKEVAGTAALGARLAVSSVASGVKSYGQKTTGWFSRKGEQFTNATRKKFNAAANTAGRAATAASRAVESSETTADRLLTELESNPSNAARNSKIAQVRAQLAKVRTGWGSGSKKADLERRLREVVAAPVAAAANAAATPQPSTKNAAELNNPNPFASDVDANNNSGNNA